MKEKAAAALLLSVAIGVAGYFGYREYKERTAPDLPSVWIIPCDLRVRVIGTTAAVAYSMNYGDIEKSKEQIERSWKSSDVKVEPVVRFDAYRSLELFAQLADHKYQSADKLIDFYKKRCEAEPTMEDIISESEWLKKHSTK